MKVKIILCCVLCRKFFEPWTGHLPKPAVCVDCKCKR